ncbi:MAG TPA: sigma-70 family RNA polymerase sigma factor [Lacipirellulaceae bacterium]|nr:sigma-70 family RNA polymerase sigma factor [Lacipirellulaceae bacterium]
MANDDDPPDATPAHVAAMRELAGLWVQSQSVIAAYVSANVYDAHHVEDLVQEVARVCAEKFDEYDRQRAFTSWALGIARHRLLKYYRSRRRDRLVLSEPALAQLEAALERVHPEVEARREALRHCLAKIDGRRREVLDMRYRDNAKVVDLAEHFGMSASAVSVMLHRVRAVLFACVERWMSQKGA